MTLETKKSFWAALLSLALISAAGAAWLFPKAMPLLQVQVSLSRDQALDAAMALQTQRFSELSTTRAVARFEHDDALQNYIELEGGGVDAYTALLGQRFIATYYWNVRRFSESQENELSVRFTPEGYPYGFTRKLPEKAPGAALTEAPARAIAEAGARSLLGDAVWNSYAPLSASQVTRPGGRIDHSFVYEHQSEKRAEARFRVKLVVAGERLVEVTPYAFVPQAFEQRFNQLRAGNETIAKVATIAMFSLFGLGGLLGGWLWLARRGGLTWKPALVAGVVVGALAAAAVLSSLPLRWFGYATTESASNFLLRNGAFAVVAAVATTLLLGLIFAVAEGLSRRAFAQHPRVFNFWSVAAAASPQALGRTVGGYAWMAIELLLVSGFYWVARTQFGWWVPTESLSDPNILSAWRPALEPIANALQAGTMEESLFRAVPLAAAALIGTRLGRRRSAIAVALVLQALVFAGAHANYPGLPSYSRLVELFVPALVWGLIFLRYGLVPCMLMHFTFDLTLMSLPLFVATDARLWLDRALVLLAGLVPLLMVLRARFKQGHFADLASSLRNGESASVAAVATHEAVTAAAAPELPPETARPWWLQCTPLLIAAVIGISALFLWPAPQVQTPKFTVDHRDAIARAESVLAERGVRLDADWKRLAIVRPAAGGDAKALSFVWREAGPQVFERLLGSTILPQHWQVLFKHTSGPVEERAEVWEVALTGQGEVLAVEHHLPEGRPGAKLDREQAQALVHSYMEGQTALAHRPWTLASVEEKERPERRDWTFYWDDKQALDVKGGTSRVAVKVRGDELTAWQYVFVPDAWQREQQTKESAKTPFKIAAIVAAAALILLVFGLTLRQVVQGQLHWRQGLIWGGLLSVPAMTGYGLSFDRKAMAFNVAQDWSTQLTTTVALAAAGYLLLAALLGLMGMRLHSQQRPSNAAVASDLLRGLSLAFLYLGLQTTLQHFFPDNSPNLPGVAAWDSVQPLWTTVMACFGGLFANLADVALTLSAVHFCCTRRRTAWLGSLVALVALSSTFAAETLGTGLAMVLPILLSVLTTWVLVRRGEIGVAIAFQTLSLFGELPKNMAAPTANAGNLAVVSCVVTLALAWWALRYGRSLGAKRT
jgi:hypothetical protein